MINFTKLTHSFYYAFEGICFAAKHNQNLKINFIMSFCVIIASIFFHVTPFEMGILGVMIVLLASVELVNTALEEMTDLIVKEHREQAKITKDVAAGMVLLTLVGYLIVIFLIFTPYVLKLLHLGSIY